MNNEGVKLTTKGTKNTKCKCENLTQRRNSFILLIFVFICEIRGSKAD